MPQLGLLDVQGQAGRYHSVSANPNRFEAGAPLVEDSRWSTDMPLGPRFAVTVATAPVLAAHDLLLRRHSTPVA